VVDKDNSLAIIIDQWHLVGINNQPADNIIDFLNSGQVSTAVLSSYVCVMEEYTADNLWYNNEKNLFKKNPGNYGLLIEDYRNNAKTSIIYGGSYSNTTHPDILNYQNSGLFQLAMRQGWQIQHYVDQFNPQVKNIFVLGSSWEKCVRDRPLGYLNLARIFAGQDIKILTYTGCISGQTAETFDVDLDQEANWKQIRSDIYQYCPD
jgi:hypothetical protein